jgi:hypothetical protein
LIFLQQQESQLELFVIICQKKIKLFDTRVTFMPVCFSLRPLSLSPTLPHSLSLFLPPSLILSLSLSFFVSRVWLFFALEAKKMFGKSAEGAKSSSSDSIKWRER